MDHHLPADRFAQEIRSLLARTDMSLDALADSIDVHPRWLRRVMTGEITELTLLTVVGICRRLRVMPEDIWDPGLVARAFAGFPATTFDPDDGA